MQALSEKFLYLSSIGLRVTGVPVDYFIRHTQGCSRDDGIILHKSAEQRPLMFAHFEDFETEPECLWGTGIYRVRKDGTLLLLRSDYDSSD